MLACHNTTVKRDKEHLSKYAFLKDFCFRKDEADRLFFFFNSSDKYN